MTELTPLARIGLLLLRPGMLVIAAPAFGSGFAPAPVRLGITLLLALTLVPVVALPETINPAAIAEAMSASLDSRCRERLVARGLDVARRHNWRTTAQAHLAVYDTLRGAVHA